MVLFHHRGLSMHMVKVAMVLFHHRGLSMVMEVVYGAIPP